MTQQTFGDEAASRIYNIHVGGSDLKTVESRWMTTNEVGAHQQSFTMKMLLCAVRHSHLFFYHAVSKFLQKTFCKRTQTFILRFFVPCRELLLLGNVNTPST